MSTYTDIEHETVLRKTLYWQTKQPSTTEEYFEYAQYQYALKDYKEAVIWYKKAAIEQYIPALYQLAYCLHHQLGIASDDETETSLFKKVIAHDEIANDAEASYRLGMMYTYGYGTEIDEKKGLFYFNQAKEESCQSLYEIGLFYKIGKNGMAVDKAKAEQYFRTAYDQHCEQAIFALFDLFEGNFEEFTYIREIKEAYSFTLGQLMRVAELKPCKEYLLRLADFYGQGYPGDTDENLKKFDRLAKKYRQKAADIMIE